MRTVLTEYCMTRKTGGVGWCLADG